MTQSAMLIIIGWMILFGFHCLADYPLQGAYLAIGKINDRYLLICHVMIYSIVTTFGFGITCYYGGISYIFWSYSTTIFLCMVASHYIIDSVKCNLNRKLNDLDTNMSPQMVKKMLASDINLYAKYIITGGKKEVEEKLLMFDQLIHILIIMLIWVVLLTTATAI